MSTSAILPEGVPEALVTLEFTATLWPWVMLSGAVAPLSWRELVVALKPGLAQLLTIWLAFTLPRPLAMAYPTVAL